ncbi:MAG: isoprenylcysteine carboxylmethyltransferase family protein [Anaerolineales bacterium]
MNGQKRLISPRVIAQLLIFIVIIPFLPLLISGHWGWWEAWVFGALNVFIFAISRVLAARRNPDLIAERAQYMQQENIVSWDKLLAVLLTIATILFMLVAGLDELLDWSPPYSLPLKIISLIVILLGYVLSTYAFIENRFFSGTVRIQAERGHQVVSSGPYKWIRHPGYAGGLLTYLVAPLLLDSYWTFLPIGFLVILVITRTYLEDRYLQGALDGYREYAKQVRYRLLPGVW